MLLEFLADYLPTGNKLKTACLLKNSGGMFDSWKYKPFMHLVVYTKRIRQINTRFYRPEKQGQLRQFRM